MTTAYGTIIIQCTYRNLSDKGRQPWLLQGMRINAKRLSVTLPLDERRDTSYCSDAR